MCQIIKKKNCVKYSDTTLLSRNDISTTFLQQVLSGKLLLVVIISAKK